MNIPNYNIPNEQAIYLVFIGFLVIFCFLLLLVIKQGIQHTRLLRSNPPRKEQEAKMLDVAHEIEDTIHKIGQVPFYDHAYLDPVLQMYVVGRVSRVQLHDAIIDWVKRGTDFRIEENKFWLKKN